MTAILLAALAASVADSSLDPETVGDHAAVRDETAASAAAANTEALVVRFYRERNGALAWFNRSGAVRRRTLSALRQLEHADKDGLRPRDYDVAGLKLALRKQAQNPSRSPADLASLDSRITAAVLGYARDLAHGRVSPARAEVVARRSDPGIDIVAVVARGIAEGDVRGVLADLAPPHEEYARLRDALAHYRALASSGGWPRLDAPETLQPGKRYESEVLEALRQRLAADEAAGDTVTQLRQPAKAAGAAAKARQAFVYDGVLADIVRRFQNERGIDADGVIGAKTLAELNRSPADIVRTIEVNMERWRWLPRDLGQRHIRADVPSFELSAYDDGQVALSMRLIAGQKEWPTPLFSDRVEYVVLNPTWHVPKRIATEEILPKAAEDPFYFYRNGIDLVSGEGEHQRVMQPYRVELAPFLYQEFPYKLRQGPGPLNPLGQIKFVMPNDYDVYLHDTSNRSLFARSDRALSHGCIRVEKPLDLAAWLLNGAGGWSQDKLGREIDTDEREVVHVTDTVPVHLTYFTAVVGDDGRLALRPDVYGIDEKLAEALHLSPQHQTAQALTPQS